MERTTRQKINKEILDLSDTIKQLDLADIYKTFHPGSSRIYILLKDTWTFSRIDYMLGHKIINNTF